MMPRFCSDKKEPSITNNNDRSEYLEKLKSKLSQEQLRQMSSTWAKLMRELRSFGDISAVDWTEFKISAIENESSMRF